MKINELIEREEEKQYRIKFFENEHFVDVRTEDEINMIKYTETEIENFPPEIKGAIKCGFLIKDEVSK